MDLLHGEHEPIVRTLEEFSVVVFHGTMSLSFASDPLVALTGLHAGLRGLPQV
jgi:hypothetical protein